MAGWLQERLREDGRAMRAAAAVYAWTVADLYRDALEGVDLGAGPLLDLGAGPGEVTAWLAKRAAGRAVVACDLSPAMLRRAARRVPGHVRRVAGDAVRLPFRDAVFGAAVSCGSLKFWPDASAGLSEIARVVGAGGRVVVVDLDREAADAEVVAFLRRIRLPLLTGPWAVRQTRRSLLARALDARGVHAAAAPVLDAPAVARVPGLPFLRLEGTVRGR